MDPDAIEALIEEKREQTIARLLALLEDDSTPADWGMEETDER